MVSVARGMRLNITLYVHCVLDVFYFILLVAFLCSYQLLS